MAQEKQNDDRQEDEQNPSTATSETGQMKPLDKNNRLRMMLALFTSELRLQGRDDIDIDKIDISWDDDDSINLAHLKSSVKRSLEALASRIEALPPKQKQKFKQKSFDPKRMILQLEEIPTEPPSVETLRQFFYLQSLIDFADHAVENQELLQILPRLTSIVPPNYLIPNHKVVNTMTSDVVDEGPVNVIVSKPNAKQMVFIACTFDFDESKTGVRVELSGKHSFTEYDRNVYNAVTSLYVCGDSSHVMTPDMVYRAMNGMGNQEKPGPKQLEAVIESLEKMRRIHALINIKPELEHRRITVGGGYVTRGMIDSFLLSARVLEVEAGGKTVRAYKILEAPILYDYSRLMKQVYTVKSSLLDIRTEAKNRDGTPKLDSATGQPILERVRNSDSRIAIKNYLLRRIEGMKGRNALASNTISFQSYDDENGKHHQGLYEIVGIPEPSRTEANRIRDYIKAVLEYWKSQRYISGYQFIAKRSQKVISGVEIYLNDTSKNNRLH